MAHQSTVFFFWKKIQTRKQAIKHPLQIHLENWPIVCKGNGWCTYLIHSRTSRKGWQNRTNGYLTKFKRQRNLTISTNRTFGNSGPKIAADPIVSRFLPFFCVNSFQNKLYYNSTINSTLMKRHRLSCWKCFKNTKSLQWLSPQSFRWVNSHVPFPQEINATERQNLTQRSSFACLFCARNRFFIQNKRCNQSALWANSWIDTWFWHMMFNVIWFREFCGWLSYLEYEQ